ncbi:MAG TPA: NYN domain-containing protein [Candidatus Limnocylindria bacterium]|nr:NYN domain-containing protein [Candidatus Limnocylindria bacterium]
MSKNVAVFVDVANIFYAAKAAGVDIDYVTLLKAATAGRDFVRAYAYTGLDPENDNQRQFHAFLARSGYKVISKDIRKYGDGRIKANLDIELVVDLMKTARNLDIAVVVSGDGDFASAIRAVQEMGVRVEVISFRGNTSSDLIDVADMFTDIAQVARVEKGSARSGRRVAAEGDLSMTEVPEKETEGAPRRRRTTRAAEERQRTPVAAAAAAAAAADSANGANLVAMPGERLSRGPAGEELEVEGAEEALDGGAGSDGLSDDGRRRRRRRGGRGRGRGRRTDEEGNPLEPVAASAGGEDDEEFDEPQPANLPHQTFGSVWDSQIGIPTSASGVDTLSGGEALDEEDLEEPEVPEYLLAERRQRGGARVGGRPGARPARGRSAYQAALDRERYGSAGAPRPAFSGTSSTGSRGGGNRDRGRGGRPMGQSTGRPTRAPRMDDRPRYDEARSSSEPWSEVPPELEEMLRAELSRKSPAASVSESAAPSEMPSPRSAMPSPMSEMPSPMSEMPSPIASFGTANTDEAAAAKPARRTRTTKATSEATTADGEAPAKATRSRTTKAATTRSTTTRAPKAATTADGDDAPKKATRTRKQAAPSEPAADSAPEATEG